MRCLQESSRRRRLQTGQCLGQQALYKRRLEAASLSRPVCFESTRKHSWFLFINKERVTKKEQGYGRRKNAQAERLSKRYALVEGGMLCLFVETIEGSELSRGMPVTGFLCGRHRRYVQFSERPQIGFFADGLLANCILCQRRTLSILHDPD